MEKIISRREFLKVSAATGVLGMAPHITLAQEPKPIQLLKPQMGSSSPFLQLLWKRMSLKEFSPEPFPVEVLSNLLWAAFGINRADGRRTAPTASNRQEIDIYAAAANGTAAESTQQSLGAKSIDGAPPTRLRCRCYQRLQS